MGNECEICKNPEDEANRRKGYELEKPKDEIPKQK
jgi:hypothetical protein